MITQFLIAMLASASFAILFSVPWKQCFFCALTGASGWLCYLIIEPEAGSVIASLVATFLLTILSRIFASLRKSPVTLYLVTGIFPLVPGSGIYYTSYYFIMNEVELFLSYAQETIKLAGAIALGIIFALAIPQSLFRFSSK